MDFNTLGSSFDTTLGIYTGVTRVSTNGALTNFTTIASNDDDTEGGGLLTSRASFNAVAGTTYQIAVDGFDGATGNIS